MATGCRDDGGISLRSGADFRAVGAASWRADRTAACCLLARASPPRVAPLPAAWPPLCRSARRGRCAAEPCPLVVPARREAPTERPQSSSCRCRGHPSALWSTATTRFARLRAARRNPRQGRRGRVLPPARLRRPAAWSPASLAGHHTLAVPRASTDRDTAGYRRTVAAPAARPAAGWPEQRPSTRPRPATAVQEHRFGARPTAGRYTPNRRAAPERPTP